MRWLLVFVLFVLTQAVPQCRWACDDPVCNAVCWPRCAEPLCVFNCTCNEEPECEVRCPNSTATDCSESCPACETVCEEPDHACKDCEILCEAPNCGWLSRKGNCVQPRCELFCEQPACAFVEPSPAHRFSLF